MQERAIKTKSDILIAARKEFSEKGFHGARVDEVASLAGVNKQRIYAYYNSKEGLFEAVLRDAFETIMVEEESLLKIMEDDIPHLTERLVTFYFDFYDRREHFWRLLLWENLDGGRHIKNLSGIKAPVMEHLSQLYKKGQKEDVFLNSVSFESYVYTILSVSFFYYSNMMTLSQTLQLDLKKKSNRKQMISEVLKMLNCAQ